LLLPRSSKFQKLPPRHPSGNFVGHYDSRVSEYAANRLMKEVDDRVSAEMAKNPNTLDDTIPACLIDTFEKFDARLHRTMIERMCAMDSKPWNEWTLDDVPRFLGVKELGEHDPYPVMRRSCAGSTALSALLYLKGIIMVNKICGLLPSETLNEVSNFILFIPCQTEHFKEMTL